MEKTTARRLEAVRRDAVCEEWGAESIWRGGVAKKAEEGAEEKEQYRFRYEGKEVIIGAEKATREIVAQEHGEHYDLCNPKNRRVFADLKRRGKKKAFQGAGGWVGSIFRRAERCKGPQRIPNSLTEKAR